MFKNNKSVVFILSLLALVGTATSVKAKPNVDKNGLRPAPQLKGQLKTTAGCRPAESSVDLDINNVRARIMTGGDMWWDNGTQEARYEVPKGQRKNALFAGSVWVGGIDVQKQLKVAAQTYRQSGNDYWPGPLDANANVDEATCTAWDYFWKINATDITRFRELGDKQAASEDPAYQAIFTWPAKGNPNPRGRNNVQLSLTAGKDYAPFVDVSGPNGSAPDGLYNPIDGDYPEINGDQYIWWVFNDKGNVKQQSQTEGIGMEVQASAFGYTRQDAMNDATFYNYRLINRGALTLDSCYMATWTDADLGFATDDYIGCDTARGLGVLYNGKSVDGNGEVTSYGSEVPMVGVDFFLGPTKYYDTIINGQPTKVGRRMPMQVFTYYNNDASIIGNPNNGAQIYFYMTGSILTGQRFSYDFTGPGVISKGYGSGPAIPFVFPGDPSDKNAWSECTCNNPSGDRRFIHSAGAFKLDPGVVNDVTIGAVWVSNVGGCPNTSFKKIQAADDLAQALFNNNFRAIEGPEAPKVVVREMDRKLVFYLTNEPNSNNYQEKFGYDLSEQRYRVSALTTKSDKNYADSLYKFEGYRVFQLRDGDVRAADVFLPSGAVNTELAIEIFQTDIKNGVKQVVNYNKDLEVDNAFNAVSKLTGKDSGIRHSFEVREDQFATGFDKKLINYRNYYFVAIAYAYNNFRPFRYDSLSYTQDVTYLGSEKGQGGTAIPIVAAMPNPANGNMGTVINSDYGTGVIIKRIEGRGNGGNELDMDEASEAEALAAPEYQSYQPVYRAGAGPINVRVVDPLKVQGADWELHITGAVKDNTLDPNESRGIHDSTAAWMLINKTDNSTIYSERNLVVANEQILEKYGLGITVNQVARPGDDQAGKNGLISSSISFEDPTKPWLAGVTDAEGPDYRNWIRSGGVTTDTNRSCNFNDVVGPGYDSVTQVYEKLLPQYITTIGSWAPYGLGAIEEDAEFPCGFGTRRKMTSVTLFGTPSIDIVFTSDKSKWTRCVVIEMQGSTQLAEGGASRWLAREHAGWNGDVAANGSPIYSSDPADRGMSWFPGYAINQESGERLNMVFGEDSWLKNYNGADMIWNPSTEDIITQQFTGQSLNVFGGRHFVYVMGTKYDEGKSFMEELKKQPLIVDRAYRKMLWVGMPLLAKGQRFLPLSENLIPTTTRLRFRVDRPYQPYITNTTPGAVPRNNWNPLYEFSTKGLEPIPLANNGGADKDRLLSRIGVVPNPYYAYAGYERNRLDTRVRIVNLPAKASIFIYTLDGALVRSLTKDNANQSYIDWDLRNARGLAISSGMYLIHVKADGIGETVLKWFGALRPIDITTY